MKLIPLTQGLFAKVDDADFEWLMQWKWSASKGHKTWYAVRRERIPNGGYRMICMHRLILGVEGRTRGDHRNGDGCDNQRRNLRNASHKDNIANRGKNANNTSGFKGVSWSKTAKKWWAKIQVSGKQISLGYFEEKWRAALAYDCAACEHFGEFAVLNLPVLV